MDDDDFKEYRRLFIAELERLAKESEKLTKENQSLRTELKVLQFKVATVATVISTGVGIALKFIIK